MMCALHSDLSYFNKQQEYLSDMPTLFQDTRENGILFHFVLLSLAMKALEIKSIVNSKSYIFLDKLQYNSVYVHF